MTDERQVKPSVIAGHVVRFLAEDCGAARHDRLFLIGGGGIVCALLVFMWAARGLDPAADSAGADPGASAAVAIKTVSAGPLRVPDPPPAQGGEGSESRIFVAADHSDALSTRPDRETQLLEAELARIREAEALAAPEEGAAVHAVTGDESGS